MFAPLVPSKAAPQHPIMTARGQKHNWDRSEENLNKIQSLFLIYITYNAILQGFLHIRFPPE